MILPKLWAEVAPEARGNQQTPSLKIQFLGKPTSPTQALPSMKDLAQPSLSITPDLTKIQSLQKLRMGGESGGGGDAVLLDITAVHQFIFENSGDWATLKYNHIDIQKLKEQLQSLSKSGHIKIIAEEILEDGRSSWGHIDRQNQEIFFSRRFWLDSGSDIFRKIPTVVHAYLEWMSREDLTNFQISKDLVEELRFLVLLNGEMTISMGEPVFSSQEIQGHQIILKNPRLRMDGSPWASPIILVARMTGTQSAYAQEICKKLGYAGNRASYKTIDAYKSQGPLLAMNERGNGFQIVKWTGGGFSQLSEITCENKSDRSYQWNWHLKKK